MQRSEVSSHDDNPILDQAIAEFLRTEVAGQAVNQQRWFDDYPQCASGLEDVNSSGTPRGSDGDLRRVNIEQAIHSYRRALDQDPRHFSARFQLARCLLAIGRNEESIESLGACIALRPDSPWAYTARGLVEGLSGRREDAVRDLDRAVALDAEFLPARLNRGVVRWLHSMNDNDPRETRAALVDFDAVLAAPPEGRLVEAAFYRAQIRLTQKDFSGALEDATHVCDERATFAAAHRLRAKICFLMADERDGILAMQRFLATSGRLAVDPATPQGHLALGKSLRLLAMELVDDSRLRVLHRAAQELRAAATQPSAEAYQHLGAVQEQLGQSQDAVASYTEGLKLNDDSTLRNLRGWAHVSCSEFELAQNDFDASIHLEPTNGEAHAGLGYVHAMLGRGDKAREEAAMALLNSAGNHLVLHNAACVYGRLSQTDEVRHLENENLALASLEQALQSWRLQQVGPDELDLIRHETAFPESLRSRPEFKRLTASDDHAQ